MEELCWPIVFEEYEGEGTMSSVKLKPGWADCSQKNDELDNEQNLGELNAD